MIKYEIEGGHLPVLICYPEPGQTLCTESGAMSWMSSNMKMDTNTGGGMKKVLGRMFTGEPIFMNEYTAERTSGMTAFASRFPGSIIPYQVTGANSIIVQKNGFLAMEKGLDLSIYFQKKLGKGFFGGEGFIMQKISGNGMVFLEIAVPGGLCCQPGDLFVRRAAVTLHKDVDGRASVFCIRQPVQQHLRRLAGKLHLPTQQHQPVGARDEKIVP